METIETEKKAKIRTTQTDIQELLEGVDKQLLLRLLDSLIEEQMPALERDTKVKGEL